MMQLFVAESTALRVEKMDKIHNKYDINIFKDILNTLQYESGQILYKAGLDAIMYLLDANEQDKFINALIYLTSVKPENYVQARRNIANRLIEDNKYTFSNY